MTWLLDSQADKTIVRPDSRECTGKFQDLLGTFSLTMDRVGAIVTLSNCHFTSRMFVFFSNPSRERVPRGKMKVLCLNKNMDVDGWEVKKDGDKVTLRGEKGSCSHPSSKMKEVKKLGRYSGIELFLKVVFG